MCCARASSLSSCPQWFEQEGEAAVLDTLRDLFFEYIAQFKSDEQKELIDEFFVVLYEGRLDGRFDGLANPEAAKVDILLDILETHVVHEYEQDGETMEVTLADKAWEKFKDYYEYTHHTFLNDPEYEDLLWVDEDEASQRPEATEQRGQINLQDEQQQVRLRPGLCVWMPEGDTRMYARLSTRARRVRGTHGPHRNALHRTACMARAQYARTRTRARTARKTCAARAHVLAASGMHRAHGRRWRMVFSALAARVAGLHG